MCIAVLLSFFAPLPVSAALPAGFQEYYVLGYEEHVWWAFREINDDPDPWGLLVGRICSTVNLVATTDYQIVYYDHWEDGYEADLLNPIQPTTQIYGDGDLSNGGSESDILSTGDAINLTSNQDITGTTAITGYVSVNPARDPNDLRYDGGDRIITSGGPVNLTHAMWPLDNTWVGGAWEVYSRQAYANTYSYRLPVGEDLYDVGGGDEGTYGDFRNVYLQLGTFEDNTTVSISNDTGTVNLTLDRGQTYFSMGYINSTSAPTITINAGTVIRTNKPTQVGLITGADGHFQGRFLIVLPDRQWGADHVVPIPRGYGRGDDDGWPDAPAEVYLSNPNNFPIEIHAYDATTQTSFIISPTTAYTNATVAYSQKRGGSYIPQDSAARFTSADGVFGVVVCADTSHIDYDWGFSGIPSKYLTRDYYVSWAPGDANTPPRNNGSPVWVTPLADGTTFYVDFNESIGGLDGVVDEIFTLDVLQQRRIFDPDDDNTGMHVWATGEFAVAWGADPRTADPSDSYLDLGVAMLPLQQHWLDPVLTLDKTADPTILPSTGGIVTFTLVAQSYNTPLVNVDISDTLPIRWTYVPSSTHIIYPDSSTGNPDPATADRLPGRRTLFWDISTDLEFNQSLTLTFQAQITNTGGVETSVYDGFESGDYSGGANWGASHWQEQGDDDDPATGTVRITSSDSPIAGDFHLRIQGNDTVTNSYAISRSVDLSDFSTPVLHFMRQVRSLEFGDYFYLDIYDGVSWTTALTWTNGSQEFTTIGEAVNLTPYADVSSAIRFRSGNIFDEDILLIDQIKIREGLAISVNQGEAIGKDEYSNALFNPTDEATVHISPLNLSKSVSSAEVGIGDTLVYTLSFTNLGDSAATNVVVRDAIPTQYVTFQSVSDGGAYSGDGGIVMLTDTLAPGDSGAVTFTVTVNDFVEDGALIENIAYVDSDQTVKAGSNVVRTTVLAPDVEFTKLGPTVAYPGDEITYTLSYENVGQAPATQVTIQDTIPPSATYVSGSLAINTGDGWITPTDPHQGAFVSPTLIITPGVTPGIIAAGETGQIHFSVRLNADLPLGSLVQNWATLDRHLDNPRDTNLVITRISDLLIAKKAEPTEVLAGDTITYTLIYTNVSTTDSQTAVYVREPIPDYTRFITVTESAGNQVEYSWDNGATWNSTLPITPVTHIRWHDANVPTNTQVTLGFTVQVATTMPPHTVIQNTATITSEDTAAHFNGWIPSNQVQITTVDLWVEKSINRHTAQAGNPVSYTITYGNRGSADVSGVQIWDTIPVGADYIPGSIWGTGAYTDGTPTLLWNVGTVAAGSSAQKVGYAVVLNSSLLPGTAITNTAILSSAYGLETSEPVTVTITPPADLTVTKSSSPSTVNAGEMLTYTIVISNDGSGHAVGVAVSDTLPANTRFVPNSITLDPSDAGTIGTSPPTLVSDMLITGGQRVTVTFAVTVTAALTDGAVITNTAWATSDQAITSADTITTPVETVADLTVTKSDSPDPVWIGATLTYTLVYTNAGPSDAQGVYITDTLPVSVTYGGVVRAPPPLSSPTVTLPYLTWYTPTLAAEVSGAIVFTVTVNADTGSVFTNSVTITSVTTDPTPGNNSADEPTNLPIPEVDFGSATYTVTEDDGATTITVTLSHPSSFPVTVDYATFDGTATAGDDYTAASGALNFAPLSTTQTFTVSITPDLIDELNETIILTLTGATSATVGSPANLTILDDDDPPTADFSASTYTVGESDGTATITVFLNRSSSSLVSVDYQTTTGGTATPGDDYTATSGTLSFPPLSTAQTFTVSIISDLIDEPNETVVLTLTGATNATVGDTHNPANLTILDNDTAGTSINPTSITVIEGSVTNTYQVVLNSEPMNTVTVTVNTDAQITPIAPITFTALNWNSPQTVAVSAVDDAVDESTPHLSVISHTATSGDPYYNGIAIADVTVFICDNDLPGVCVSPITVSVSESGVTDTYQIVLTVQPASTVIITFATDIQLDPIPPLTFTPLTWNSPQTITVSAVDDDVDESSPHFSAIFHTATSDDADYDGVVISNVTVSITDDDTAWVNVNPTTVSVSESGITDTYQVVLITQPIATVTITIVTDTQLDPIPPLTFTPLTWNSPQTVTVTAVDDDVDESSPHSTIFHTAASDDANYDGTFISNVAVNITDNDTAGVNVNPATVSVTEDGLLDTYQVVLTSQPIATVTITFATDLQIAPILPLTFTPWTWNSPQTVIVSAVDDDVDETSPHFSAITHSASSNDPKYNGIAPIADVIASITDNDPEPTISIADVTVTEGDVGTMGAIFTVTLSAASGKTVTVSYATADGSAAAPDDYTAILTQTMTFTPGATSRFIAVSVNGDTLDENNETFWVNLANATHTAIADGQGQGTILDDDGLPMVDFDSENYSVGESDGSIIITVTLSAESGRTVTVDYETIDDTATAPADYVASSGTLTFTAAITIQTFTVNINDDVINENPETLTLDLSNPSNATIGGNDPATLTVFDNDDLPTADFGAFNYFVGESDGAATITVTLSVPSSFPVTVDYATLNGTATAGDDYTAASGALSFPPLSTTRTFTVSIIPDPVDEPNETVVLSLTGATSATVGAAHNPATLVILNDDGPATIQGTVFLDINGNGVQNAGEVGIPNVLITLEATSPTAITTTTTGANGHYTFTVTTTGVHTVIETDPLHAAAASTTAPMDPRYYFSTTPNEVHVNVIRNHTYQVNFGDALPNSNFASIHGVVFEDIDGDGVRDAAELGISGVIITLDGYTATTTNLYGSYTFSVTMSGVHIITATEPNGYFSTTPNEVHVDTSLGRAYQVNFGNAPTSSSFAAIYGVVFDDINGNGLHHGSETGIPNVTITLDGDVTVTTGLYGGYTLSTTIAGVHTVLETDPNGYTSTTSNIVTRSVTLGNGYQVDFGDKGTCSPDPYEDDDTIEQAKQAERFVVGPSSQAHQFCQDATDWVRFTARAYTVYTITTSSWGQWADTILTLVASDDPTQTLAYNDDCEGATDGSSCIIWEAPTSGDYYVRTTNQNGFIGRNTGYDLWIKDQDLSTIYLPIVMRNP